MGSDAAKTGMILMARMELQKIVDEIHALRKEIREPEIEHEGDASNQTFYPQAD